MITSETMKPVLTAVRLTGNLCEQRLFYGERWNDVTRDIRTKLLAVMAANRETNPLAIAVPIAKKMNDSGENPMLLLAVATELSMDSGQ